MPLKVGSVFGVPWWRDSAICSFQKIEVVKISPTYYLSYVSILIMILLCTNIVFWLTFVAEMRFCFKQISVGMILRTQNLMFICANFLFCFKRNDFGRFSLSRQGAIGLLLMILQSLFERVISNTIHYEN